MQYRDEVVGDNTNNGTVHAKTNGLSTIDRRLINLKIRNAQFFLAKAVFLFLVGADDGEAVGGELFDEAQVPVYALRIEVRGRLVEHQHFGI